MDQLNFTRNQTDNFYDPDAGLDSEIREIGCRFSVSFIHRLRLKANQVLDRETGNPLPGFMHVEAGGEAHLLFVRVTVNDEVEIGIGPMPGILIDQARFFKAQPHVLRVHLRSNEYGVDVEYFGHDDLAEEWQRSDWWRRKLLHGVTARECLRLVGGQPSRLEVLVKFDPPGMRTPKPIEPELAAIFGEDKERSMEPYYYNGAVQLALKVTPDPRTTTDHACIWVSSLLVSTYDNDECYIFNCDCGSIGCAGIRAGVDVVNEDGLVVWRMRGNHPCRLLVFDREQYRREIITKVRVALDWAKANGPKALFIGAPDVKWVEKALYRAEEK